MGFRSVAPSGDRPKDFRTRGARGRSRPRLDPVLACRDHRGMQEEPPAARYRRPPNPESADESSRVRIERPVHPRGVHPGAATAAYQIEGAASKDGRGPSIWDTFSHTPGATAEGATGDTAAGHYDNVTTDLDLMASLHLDAYRFSISWSRVMPEGEGAVNGAGLAFYSTLVDGLLARGIRPVVTLNHWDLPRCSRTSTAAGEDARRPTHSNATRRSSVRHWATAWRSGPRTTNLGTTRSPATAMASSRRE